MKALFYSRPALNDLVRLRAFIAEDNPSAARRIAAQLTRGIGRLSDFPLLGQPVDQAPKPEMIRDLVLGKYVVRYLVRTRSITILRIWHHRENPPD